MGEVNATLPQLKKPTPFINQIIIEIVAFYMANKSQPTVRENLLTTARISQSQHVRRHEPPPAGFQPVLLTGFIYGELLGCDYR
ncbi:MAG: hypothetical protein AAF404_07190 [Pseudomonadota bacterium]